MSEIQVDAADGILFAARFAGGRMTDLLADWLDDPDPTGALLLGRVDRVDRAGQGAFLDLGDGRHGWLAAGEERAGALLLVQPTGPAREDKGLPLTRDLALAGRWLVRLPRSGAVALSRSLDPATREAWRRRLGPGWIVRGAAITAPEEAVAAEAAALEALWRQAEREAAARGRPGLVAPPPGIARRLAIDHPDADRLRVAPAASRLVPALPALGAPELAATDILDRLPALRAAVVPLPGGGSLVLEPGRTLTAIDVNAGAGRDGVAANLEAAVEAAVQLRLRNLGGIVVVDFIGMAREADRRAVVRRLADALAGDPADIRLTPRLSPLGLAELARQRRGRALHEVLGSGSSADGSRSEGA